MLVVYAAVFDDPNDAVEAVKKAINFDVGGEKIEMAAPLLDATVTALGMSPGEVRML